MGSRYDHADHEPLKVPPFVRHEGRGWETFEGFPEGIKDAVLDYAERGMEFPDPEVAAVAMEWAHRERSPRMRVFKAVAVPVAVALDALGSDPTSFLSARRSRRTAKLLMRIRNSQT